ncbi:MAG: DUF3467 domain-containing protein [Acidobacteriota bacterium]|nr:MAG: DUF3467 domain-containing protein [Acidobacteriota bacterium]
MSSSPRPSKSSKPVNIKISEETQKGVYANRMIVSHTHDEFVLDFVADFPPGPQIVARVITAPRHAAALLETLRENVGRFEHRHGGIPRSSPATPKAEA